MDVLLRDAGAQCWRRFSGLVRTITARTLDDVVPALAEADAAAASGHWVAGFVSYDAAPACDRALVARSGSAEPLVHFGVFRRADTATPPAGTASDAATWTPTLDRSSYDAAIARIKAHIADGDTYQTNFTFPLTMPAPRDAAALFASLVRAQPAPYAAFVDTGDIAVCSVSPELFFTLDAGVITSRPMKGTAPRGRFAEEDAAHASQLAQSEKNRAENVMIVDMIRNDIGRIADLGTVTAASLFDVERYPTVWQMTSMVTGRTRASVTDIFRALFPCASITGAPKARTTAIIAALEPAPRGLYTGAIGFLAPNGRAQFNVAIRTVVIDRASGLARYGVGSGVTWDSDARDEYDECLAKARVLGNATRDFDLLETLRWTPREGLVLLDAHLERLRSSSEYFGRPFDDGIARAALERALTPPPDNAQRVRLLVAPDGTARATTAALTPLPTPVRLAVATTPVSSQDVFLFHKTTRRQVYDDARAAHPDVDDVLLWNERGELTETTIANVIIELDGRRYTPPVTSGLLNGTLRAALVASGDVAERVLMREDLARAAKITLINSVRGEYDATIAL